ncbi:hypothetical protein GCM10008944_19980 [Cytobacillus oceanisediminis]
MEAVAVPVASDPASRAAEAIEPAAAATRVRRVFMGPPMSGRSLCRANPTRLSTGAAILLRVVRSVLAAASATIEDVDDLGGIEDVDDLGGAGRDRTRGRSRGIHP